MKLDQVVSIAKCPKLVFDLKKEEILLANSAALRNEKVDPNLIIINI